MIGMLFNADAYIAEWVRARIPGMTAFKGYTAIGIMQDENVIAGVVYHDFSEEWKNIQLSMAAISPKWASRSVIAAILRYPFHQLGCNRITTCTSSQNERALKFNIGIGFKNEGVLRKGCGDNDLIICGLLKEEAEKWLKGKDNGKKQ